MSKVFTHGKITIALQDFNPVYRSLKDIPNVMAVLEVDDGDTVAYGLCVTAPGIGHLELRDTLNGPALTNELAKFLKVELGMTVSVYHPPLRNLTYTLLYPDIRMGDISAKQQKQFAKMILSPSTIVRMYRSHRNQELVGTIGIFGRWTCGEETGVFSICGPGPRPIKMSFDDRKQIESELQYEFAARWPLYPPAVFEIMTYEEVEPLLNKTPVTGSRKA